MGQRKNMKKCNPMSSMADGPLQALLFFFFFSLFYLYYFPFLEYFLSLWLIIMVES